MSTVLALGGDEVSLSSLHEILETFGHALVPATTPDQMLDALRRRSFDLVLFDIEMEDRDAELVVRDVLKLRPDALLVAVTAYPKEPQALRALGAGAKSLMRKPYEIGRILKILSGLGHEP
jgi:CheY-like chemotaxis protein